MCPFHAVPSFPSTCVKPFSKADKRAVIELWSARIPLKRIMEQLGMSERGLRIILAYAKPHPLDQINRKAKMLTSPPRSSLGTMMKNKKKVNRKPSISAKIL